MNGGYKIRDQSLPHFLTATIVDWIDVFSQKRYRDIVVECLRHCIEKKGMVLFGYVIMSNHIHLILQSDKGALSDLLRDFKKFTSTQIIQSIKSDPESRREWMLERFTLATKSNSRNKNHQLWQYGNHPEEIYSTEFMWSKLDYIHKNPVRAGIVIKPSHYIYSSASHYIDGEGLLQIQNADNPVVDVLNPNKFLNYLGQ